MKKHLLTLNIAARMVSRNRLRTVLMMLGVAIGIASLTTMSSVGEATKQETLKQFKRMVGTYNIINVVPGSSKTRGMPSLTTVEPSLSFEDAQALKDEATTIAQVALTQNAFDIDVKRGNNITASAIYGVSENWLEMRSYFIEVGDAITAEDVASLARVAVIGPDIQRDLFDDEDPIGQQIRIGNVPFQVKGLLETRGAGPGGSSLDGIVFIPVTTASKRLFNRDYLTTINLQLKDMENPESGVEEVRSILRERHKLADQAVDDFTISSPRASAEEVAEVRDTLSLVLTGVSVVATLIGGVVIMSLMLISVAERRNEIGLRRAIGATRIDILWQFLLEAIIISLIGGVIGVILGLAGGALAAAMQDIAPVILWGTVASAVLISIGIGLVFGIQPAWKAANTDPIEALRS